MTTTNFKHVTVRIPRPLDRWLRIEAAKRDISKSDLIRAILSHVPAETRSTQPDTDPDGQASQETEGNVSVHHHNDQIAGLE